MITVYYSKIDFFDNETAFSIYGSRLEEERRNKILRTGNPRFQVRSLATGVLLHYAVCRQLGKNPAETKAFPIACEQGGKPYLAEDLSVHFNLSHSGDYVCCAVGSQPVGVDIQKQVEIRPGIAERFFTRKDREVLASCDEERERQALFFRMWGRKESYGKLTGKGLSQSLGGFEIDWKRDVAVPGEKEAASPLAYFKEFHQLPEYTLCLCHATKEPEIRWEEVTEF